NMTFFLVMVNLTLTARFSPLFECIYLIEVFICMSTLFWIPLAVYTVWGMSAVHRNVSFRYYIIICSPFALAFDRCFATLFSSWYEKQSAATLIVFVMQSLSLEAYAWCNALFLIYEVYTVQFNIVAYMLIFVGGSILFQEILSFNVKYNRRLQKMTRSEYCLSRAYQIRENIKVMQMLRKLAFPTLIFNIPCFAFISMYAFLRYEQRLDVVKNVAVALFDLWIALYAAMFGLLTYNMEPRLQESIRRFYYAAYVLDRYDDVTGRIRKFTTRSPPPTLPNETDIYFSMLSKDLHSNKDRKYSSISKISNIHI
ncbi:hypothetical protein PENTCL1PPCAC_683, partial [Pristionchus entomophagus]